MVVGLSEEALLEMRTDAEQAGDQKAATDVQAAYRGWFARKELAAQVQQTREPDALAELGLEDTWAIHLANEAKRKGMGADVLAAKRKWSLVPGNTSQLVVTARRLVPTRFISTEPGKRFRLSRRDSGLFRWNRTGSDQGYDV